MSKYSAIAEDPYKAIAEDATPDAGTGVTVGAGAGVGADKDKKKVPPKPLLQRAKDFYKENVQVPWQRDIENMNKEAQRLSGIAFGTEGEGKKTPKMVNGKLVYEQTEKPVSTVGKIGANLAELGAESRLVLDKVALGLTDPKTAAAMIVGHVSPALAATYFATTGLQGAYEASQQGNGTYSPDNVQNLLLSLSTAAGAAGGGGAVESHGRAQGTFEPKGKFGIQEGKTTPAGTEEGRTARVISGAEKVPQGAKDLVRKGTKIAAGVGPERTTRPIAEKFEEKTAEATEQQRKANEETEAKNRAKVEEHQDARRTALQKQEKQNAEYAAKREEIRQRNEDAKQAQDRRGQLANQVKVESGSLGNDLVALRKKVKTEKIDPLYAEVRKRVANDEGIPAEEVATDVKAAQDKYVKGSPESIRQVNDVLRRAKEESGEEGEGESLMVNGREFNPQTDPVAWASFKAQGLIPEAPAPENIKFDDLQGYSSELGKQLANWDFTRYGGDVYQAIRAIKNSLDDYKVEVADRNGAGDLLSQADHAYHDFAQTFYDKPGSISSTIENVQNRLDPEYIADPFISGKAAQRSIADLRKYSPELADKAEKLRKTNDEYKALPKKAEIKPEPNPPAPVEMPGKPKFESPKEIEKPTAPTVEDVKTAKGKEFKRAMAEVQRFTKYDAALLVGSGLGTILGLFSGHPAAAATSAFVEPAFFAGRKFAGYALNRPKVIEWLSRPEPEDIAIIKKLTPEGRDEIVKELKGVADEAAAHGQKVTVNPEVAKELKFGKEYESSPKAASREGQGKGGANYTAAELKAFKDKNGIKDVPASEPRVGTPEHPPQKGESYDVGMEYPPTGSASSEPLGSKTSPSQEQSPAAQPREGVPNEYNQATLGQPQKSEVFPGAERYGIHSGGKLIGQMVIKTEGDSAHLMWVGGEDIETGTAGENLSQKLGPTGMKNVLRQYAIRHPEVKTMTGERIGGTAKGKVVSGEESGREFTFDLEKLRGRKGLIDEGNNLAKGSAADD